MLEKILSSLHVWHLQFIAGATDICRALQEAGFWADFIDPSSGRPVSHALVLAVFVCGCHFVLKIWQPGQVRGSSKEVKGKKQQVRESSGKICGICLVEELFYFPSSCWWDYFFPPWRRIAVRVNKFSSSSALRCQKLPQKFWNLFCLLNSNADYWLPGWFSSVEMSDVLYYLWFYVNRSINRSFILIRQL